MSSKPKIYLAGPFFTPEQIIIIDTLANSCTKLGFNLFNPKEDCIFDKDLQNSKEIFETNIHNINTCDYLLAVTDGKDPGTLFECGYAYRAGVPIIYVWLENNGGKFNIMLNESAYAVCLSYTQVLECLNKILNNEQQLAYKGEME